MEAAEGRGGNVGCKKQEIIKSQVKSKKEKVGLLKRIGARSVPFDRLRDRD